jgi:hypothetical protein
MNAREAITRNRDAQNVQEDHTPVWPMLLAIPGVIVDVVMLVRTGARKPGSDTDARRD